MWLQLYPSKFENKKNGLLYVVRYLFNHSEIEIRTQPQRSFYLTRRPLPLRAITRRPLLPLIRLLIFSKVSRGAMFSSDRDVIEIRDSHALAQQALDIVLHLLRSSSSCSRICGWLGQQSRINQTTKSRRSVFFFFSLIVIFTDTLFTKTHSEPIPMAISFPPTSGPAGQTVKY